MPLPPALSSLLYTCALALLTALPGELAGQDENLKFYDNTYVDYIKTIRLTVAGVPHSYPLIALGEGVLHLQFDDLSDEVRRYSYRYIHCDRDWTPSNLGQLEYNPGYSKDYLEDFDFSLRTLADYVHYDLYFPNANMPIIASGNYLLVVYDEEDEQFPVITRRFMVTERVAGLTGQVVRPAVVDRIHTHQELDVAVNTERLRLKAPLQELSLTVIQNNRWDNAVTDIAPNLLRSDRVLFNYQGKVSFQGGNEFRNLDIRSVQAPRTRMVSITNEGEFFSMLMEADRPRDFGTYLEYFDLNGDYVNFRFDRPVFNLPAGTALQDYDRLRFAYNGEYVEMTFALDTEEKLDRDIYLFGAFTEWQLKPEFRMVWNDNIGAYVGRALLKQGFYNYLYVTPRSPGDGEKGLISYERLEGTFDDTENDYLALLYYRPMAGRYDRLIGARQFNSDAD